MFSSFKNSRTGNIETDDPHVWSWVNGYVICHPNVTACRYVIRKFGDTEYLFIQWKSGDYVYGGNEPLWYVFTRFS